MRFFSTTKNLKIVAMALAFLSLSTVSMAVNLVEKDINYRLSNSTVPAQNQIFFAHTMHSMEQWENSSAAMILRGDKDPDVSALIKDFVAGIDLAVEEVEAQARELGYSGAALDQYLDDLLENSRKRISKVKLFEFQSNFIVNSVPTRFTPEYLKSMKTLTGSNSLLRNEIVVTQGQAEQVVGDSHFLVREEAFNPEAVYLYAEVDIPDYDFINYFLEKYFQSKKSPSEKEDFNADSFAIGTLSEFFAGSNPALSPTFFNAGAPYRESDVSSYLAGKIIYADHVIRAMSSVIFFQSIPGNRTLVTVKSVAAIQAHLLTPRYGMDIEDIFINGYNTPIGKIPGIVDYATKSMKQLKQNLSR